MVKMDQAFFRRTIAQKVSLLEAIKWLEAVGERLHARQATIANWVCLTRCSRMLEEASSLPGQSSSTRAYLCLYVYTNSRSKILLRISSLRTVAVSTVSCCKVVL